MLLKSKQPPLLSIVIVYYGGLTNLYELLKSIQNNRSKTSYEILLVNNKLDENIRPKLNKKYPDVRYFESPGNIGYGRGNNLGAKYSKGKYLLVVNPDVILKPGSLDVMVEYLDANPDTAIVGPNFIDQRGKLLELQGTKKLTPFRAIFALSFVNRLFPHNPVSQDYYLTKLDKQKIRNVDVVSGSCFMIRTGVFKKTGGFDKRFFLYFEESDLCKRVQEKGWNIIMLPTARAVHDWKPAEGGTKLRKYFEQSRFHYFNKHFGLMPALIVELFTRISKYSISLFLILLLAAYMRFVKIGVTTPFIGDFGWYYLQARDVLTNHFVPLVGITSSIPVLHQGVLWTYMLSFALWLGKFDPISGVVLSAILGIIGVWGTYMLSSRLMNRRAALFAALFAATFSYIVFLDRVPFQTAAIFPFTLAYFWFVKKGLEKDGLAYIFIAGVLWGLLFQLELAAFIFIPIFLVSFWLKEVKMSVIKLTSFAAGAFWGIVPFVLYDFKNGTFIQTLGFLIWFFTKIYDRIFLFSLAVLVFLLVWNIITKISRFSFPVIFIFVWAVLGSGAFYIKGNLADAYLPLMYYPLVFFAAFFIDTFISHFGKIGWLIFSFVIILNLVRFNAIIRTGERDRLRLSAQEEIAGYLVEKAGNEPFNVQYAGTGSQYESGGTNWRYLLWWKGAKLDDGLVPEYAIIQEPLTVLSGYTVINKYDGVAIAKRNEN